MCAGCASMQAATGGNCGLFGRFGLDSRSASMT